MHYCGNDLEWQQEQRHTQVKRVSRRTKYANHIRNELAALAARPGIDVVFESRIVERESLDNWFKIRIIDHSLQLGRDDEGIVQVVVWLRRDYARPISIYQECCWLDDTRHLKSVACYLDTDSDVRQLINDVRAMVEKHIAERA